MRTSVKAVVFLAGVLALAGVTREAGAQTRLEPYVEIELQRLDEAYATLDKFANDIWPGWSNYLDPEFQVQFPNLVRLLVGPRGAVPDGYQVVEGRALRGKPIYINRKAELPVTPRPPLGGGGGGGLTIRIRLQQFDPRPTAPTRPAAAGAKPVPERFDVSEGQILLYVHELFHGFQATVMPSLAPTPKPTPPASGGNGPTAPPPRSGPREPEIVVTVDYSTFSNVEALALEAAYAAADDSGARDYLGDYIVARHLKQKTMTPRAIAYENQKQLMEGTALYAETRMASLIGDAGYAGNGRHEGDPNFSAWRGMPSYLEERLHGQIRFAASNTLDTLTKYYPFGAHICFALDRVAPGWKTGFLATEKPLDRVVEETLNLSEADEQRVAARFESRYRLSALRARHAAVLKDRDDAVALVKNRKGRRYIVDFERTGEFFDTLPRGKTVRLGVEQIFVNGIKQLTLGDASLSSIDTPMHRPYLWTVEWVDTNAREGVKGYELTCRERTGAVCKGAEFKTAGFTLKAPEVEVTDTGSEVRVTILSKVAR